MAKPLFLECPPRYTRASRTSQSAADNACAVEAPARPTGYHWLWWAVTLACGVVGAIVVVVTA